MNECYEILPQVTTNKFKKTEVKTPEQQEKKLQIVSALHACIVHFYLGARSV